ncbi:MAG: addiction module protein [Verrucomicrobiota bacterium]
MDTLTPSEKLRAMEELLDELSRNSNEYMAPDWHGEVLRAREAALTHGEVEFIPWEEAGKMLRNKAE